jgi:hypothetical protein
MKKIYKICKVLENMAKGSNKFFYCTFERLCDHQQILSTFLVDFHETREGNMEINVV